MSVLGGIWNFDGTAVDRSLLADFNDSIKQQGPDGESCYVDGSIALLYHSFHTTTESRHERQPYFSPSGFVFIWDGRLDNRNELARELESDLECAPTDLAIIAAAFDRWDTDCLPRIIGDWALSIWRPRQRELIFAVDFMGIRHIFYYLKGGHVLWATDLAPLVLLSGQKFHIDDDYVSGYLAHAPDAHLTPFREIREVPPGQLVRIHGGQPVLERYWRFSPKSRICYRTDAEYEEHFRHVFRQSVCRRLRSDSPIIAELSGGLDSSSIVCMADDILAKEGAQTPRLDTLSYYDTTEPDGDDQRYFRRVEESRGRVGIHIDGSRLRSSPTSFQYSQFSPLPGAFGVGQELLKERAAILRDGGYRVVLSGIGGDELLGGIPDPRAQLADMIVRWKFFRLAQQLMAWSLVKRRPWIQLLWQSAIYLLPVCLGRYFIKEAKVESWIQGEFAKRTRLPIRRLDVDEHFKLWLPTRRTAIGGVFLMANKLAKFLTPGAHEEVRYPYLDQTLIEFVLAIPADQLLRPGERRSLMRRSLAGIVPEEILSRRTKQVGARSPTLILERYNDVLKSACENSLNSQFGYVHADRFLQLIDDARAGKQAPLVRIFRTLSLEFWLRDMVGRGLLHPPRDRRVLARQHTQQGTPSP